MYLTIAIVILLPVTLVFTTAFSAGWPHYAHAIADPYTLSALTLTLEVVAVAAAGQYRVLARRGVADWKIQIPGAVILDHAD